MILGGRCTRSCRFCAVGRGNPGAVDAEEPYRIAEAVAVLELRHVVITSVTRDDLADGGAGQFALTIKAIKKKVKGATVEVLTPDFQGSQAALEKVLAAEPDVFNHNVETVPRLYPEIRPEASYFRSLSLLKRARASNKNLVTKSGLMVGLGETREEVWALLGDLKDVGCDVVTIGQYLRPSPRQVPVKEYVLPEVFSLYRTWGAKQGFRAVQAGPFIRSSYRARETFTACFTGSRKDL
jgi:lipoic acid synthetase